MLQTRENEELEFKKTTAELRQGVVSLAAMLNKHGHGVLYFGVRNDGMITGLTLGQNTTKDISVEIKNSLRPILSPVITTENLNGKEVVRVEVSGEDKPYSAYGRYYLRSDDEDLVMTNSQLESFFIDKNIDYSKWENEATEYDETVIDETLLVRYIDEGNETGRISFNYKDTADALARLGLMKNGRLNNAGVVLFSTLKPLSLKLAVYPTSERLSFIDNRIFRGNLFECVDAAYRYIAENMRWRAEISGMRRIETPEIPVEALREIIVNSFAHMRVNKSSVNEIYLTPERIHIYNPGFLVRGKSPLDFASGRIGPVARNPLINTVLYLNKTIESFGTGFGRVFDVCGKAGIECEYGNREFGFVFEFVRPRISVATSLPTAQPRLSTTEQAVLRIIAKKVGCRKKDIAAEIGKTEMTVQRTVQKLISLGLIERVGSRKTGHWQVV